MTHNQAINLATDGNTKVIRVNTTDALVVDEALKQIIIKDHVDWNIVSDDTTRVLDTLLKHCADILSDSPDTLIPGQDSFLIGVCHIETLILEEKNKIQTGDV